MATATLKITGRGFISAVHVFLEKERDNGISYTSPAGHRRYHAALEAEAQRLNRTLRTKSS